MTTSRAASADELAGVIPDKEHAAKMEELSAALREMGEIEAEYEHIFAYGTYTRIMHLPAGSVATGKIHRHSCVNIMPKGHAILVGNDFRVEIRAPFYARSEPGVSKAIVALEDTIFMNVHPWDGEPDLDLIEKAVIVPSFEALEEECRLAVEHQS